MYLSAQRVRTPRGATGVNVALYLHTGTGLGEETWRLPPRQTVERVATGCPGRLATSRVTIKPGGNSVERSIDIVAPDGSSLADVEAAIQELRSSGLAKPQVTARVGDVTAQFSANRAFEDPVAAFNELAEPALALYAKPEPPSWTATPPLVVRVQNNDEGWIFQLDEESAKRVIAAGGRPARVRVRYDVADDFRRVYGHLYPHAAQWVTNLSGEALLELGGGRFVHRGTVVGEWPARG
jgi:hypothetical protein